MTGVEFPEMRAEVVTALKETLTSYVRDDGVWAPSSTWFVTARNP